MLLLAFRSFFFIAVILGYSTGIWRLINDYFRREFQSYLQVEAQTNQYLLRDPPKAVPMGPDVLNNQLPAGEEQDGSHQQVTDSIMALFESITTGSDAGANRKDTNLLERNEAVGTGGSKSKGERLPETVTPQEKKVATTLPVTTAAVVTAAEVSDIRPQDGRQSLSESMNKRNEKQEGQEEGEEEEEEEGDKWISYWNERRGGGDAQMDDNANAYCTVAGVRHSNADVLAGAVTRIRERVADKDAIGCD